MSIFYISKAQNVVEGAVFSKKTKIPLEGVHVYSKNNKYGVLTNNKGHYFLKIKAKINKNDTIFFSYIGYKTIQIPLSKLGKKDRSIFLENNLERLSEVKVFSKKLLKPRIGFTKLASMKVGVHSFGSVMVNDKIYVIGGDASYLIDAHLKILNDYPDISFQDMIKKMKVNYSIEKYRNNLLIYDIQGGEWEFSKMKFQKRAYHNINYYNGMYYILGGKRIQGSKNKEYLVDKIEMFNQEDKTIIIDNTNPHQAVDFTSVIYNDNLIVMGGSINKNTYGEKKYSKKIHLYNLESGLWYELEDMPKAKETRSILVDNKLYLIGGFNQIPLNEIETFDLESGKWKMEKSRKFISRN